MHARMPECPNALMARLRLELVGQCSRDEVVLHVDDDERALARYAWFGFGCGFGCGCGLWLALLRGTALQGKAHTCE